MTQNKFVTRILLIFHKSSVIPAIPAEWPMYMEMIQKLPIFVSHIYIVVMHPTAVSSYMYQHDILIGFPELNQGLAYQVVLKPIWCLYFVLMDRLSVFLNKQLQCTCTILIILLRVKCKESSAVIKLQGPVVQRPISTNPGLNF